MSSLLALISNARDQDEFEVDHGLKNAMISGLEIVVQLGWGCGAQPHVNEEWQSQGLGEQVIECVGVCVHGGWNWRESPQPAIAVLYTMLLSLIHSAEK